LLNFNLGSGLKAARTGDQIDAQVTAARGLLNQAMMSAKNFDSVEMQMNQIAQMLSQTTDPTMQMLSMQFQMLQQNIDQNQNQINSALQQLLPILNEIDGLTNKIQN
jgi:gas vesicle protein